jgi:CubicO group peptidase (beta-lactamase class C family)
MKESHIPGMQVAVVQHGKLVLTRAYGLADVQHSVPVTTKTPFSIASITKAFTGVAIMQLVEEGKGKLDLDAPVSRYLSSLPVAWRPVTIQQLLTHVSGLPDIVDQKTAARRRSLAKQIPCLWSSLPETGSGITKRTISSWAKSSKS